MFSDADFDRIQRYVTADLPDTGREATWDWIVQDPERLRAHRQLAEVWGLAADLGPAVDVERARTRLRAYMHEHPVDRSVFREQARAQASRWHFGSARSALVGVAITALVAIGLTATVVSRSRSELPTTQYHTAAGQVSRVVLRDGTVMTLAPATSVAVSGTNVDVVGEAYFAVTQSSVHPFVVRTSNTVVQVLGTAFSVRRYADETRTRVVVEDGKVAVRATRHGVVSDVPTAMTARMMAQVSDSGVSVTPVSDTRTFTGWREGMLVFNDASVRDVIAEIARCYNADIRVEGKDLANETLILEVAVRRQSLSQVLDIISLATNAHVRRDGAVYVLVPGRDVAAPSIRQQQRLPQALPQPEKLYGR